MQSLDLEQKTSFDPFQSARIGVNEYPRLNQVALGETGANQANTHLPKRTSTRLGLLRSFISNEPSTGNFIGKRDSSKSKADTLYDIVREMEEVMPSKASKQMEKKKSKEAKKIDKLQRDQPNVGTDQSHFNTRSNNGGKRRGRKETELTEYFNAAEEKISGWK